MTGCCVGCCTELEPDPVSEVVRDKGDTGASDRNVSRGGIKKFCGRRSKFDLGSRNLFAFGPRGTCCAC